MMISVNSEHRWRITVNAIFTLRELIDSPSPSAVDHLIGKYPHVSASADKYVPADKYDIAQRHTVSDYNKSTGESRLPPKIGN